MMNFILMTLSFTIAILLSGVVGILIIMQPMVMKWYLKRVTKLSNEIMLNDLCEDEAKGL